MSRIKIHAFAAIVIMFIVSCGGSGDKTPLASAPEGQPPDTSAGFEDGDANPAEDDIAVDDGQLDDTDSEPPIDLSPTDFLTPFPSDLSPSGSGPPLRGSLLELATFPVDRISSGGVPRDGIPALSDPPFTSAADAASWLSDADLVIGLVVNGEVRAYPENIGWWHEIVNDTIGGESVSVTFCPLTGTGLVFTPADGGAFELGVSGLLYNNNLVMYDRRDGRTLYPQMYFTGVQGDRQGESLALLPVVETTWQTWRELYPDTKVIANGVFTENLYSSYPYGDYRTSDRRLFPLHPNLTENANSQASFHGSKDAVLGVRLNGQPKAYPFDAMGERAVINDQVGEVDIVVVWDQASHLAIPYASQVNETTLTFDIEGIDQFPFSFRDEETGSLWNVKGEAIDGPLAGAQLSQVPAHTSFWFAWVTFWQETEV